MLPEIAPHRIPTTFATAPSRESGNPVLGPRLRRDEQLVNQLVIIRVRADPEPEQSVFGFDRQRAVPQADADGPVAPDLLQLQRGMARVFLEERVIFVGSSADGGGQVAIGFPEGRARKMPLSSRERPARCSVSACSASRSSLPALASRSTFLSKRAASNCSNHARNRSSTRNQS